MVEDVFFHPPQRSIRECLGHHPTLPAVLSFIYDVVGVKGIWIGWHDAVEWGFLDILSMAVDL